MPGSKIRNVKTNLLTLEKPSQKRRLFEMLYSQAPLYYNTTMLAGKRKKESIGEVNYRTGDERLVKLTDSAAEKVNALLQRQGRPEGVLRVAVTGGGCSGLQYKMDLQDTPANRDILVESQGIRVVVDPKSALYVTGSELDYSSGLEDSGFKVNNPNAATTCSCGESFSA